MQHLQRGKRRWGSALAASALISAAGYAAPAITQVSGTLDHKASITIQGSGFGSKSTAAPLAWDDASGSSVTQIWDGAWPDKLGTSYDLIYRGPMHGVDPPHAHDTRFIAGAHAVGTGADAGYNVVLFKNLNVSSFPTYIYASWYQRADDGWVFGGDNNYKTFAYSVCCSPYQMPNDWFTVYGPPHPGSNTDGAQWILTDDGSSLTFPDANGHNTWWSSGVNPMAGKWTKVEVYLKVTNQSDGYIRVMENGKQVVNYKGPTDRYPGTSRTVGIGGYARIRNPMNWRYFADVYLDRSLAHVVLTNSPDLSSATIIENQVPVSWNDGSITATVNLGHFSQGQTAYLIVVDGTGNASPGYPVGASGTALMPNAPTGVSVH